MYYLFIFHFRTTDLFPALQWKLGKIGDSHYLLNATDPAKEPRRLSRKCSGGADAYFLFKHRSGFSFVASMDDVVPAAWVNDMTVPQPPELELTEDPEDAEEEPERSPTTPGVEAAGPKPEPSPTTPGGLAEWLDAAPVGTSTTATSSTEGEVNLKRKASELDTSVPPSAPETSESSES